MTASIRNISKPGTLMAFVDAAINSQQANGALCLPAAWSAEAEFEPLQPAEWLGLEQAQRHYAVLAQLLGDELQELPLGQLLTALELPNHTVALSNDRYVAELFHGPSFAWADYGARLLSALLFVAKQKSTLVVAGDNDLAAATAAACYQQPEIDALLLYAEQAVTPMQERQLQCLGENILALAVAAPTEEVSGLGAALATNADRLNLTSNNIAHIYAQILSYFDAFAQLPEHALNEVTLALPEGEPGTLVAGLLAQALGLPIKRLLYPESMQQCAAWRLLEELLANGLVSAETIQAYQTDDEERLLGITRCYQKYGYLAAPNTAAAYQAISHWCEEGDIGLIIAATHPGKYRAAIENSLGTPIKLPPELQQISDLAMQVKHVSASQEALEQQLSEWQKEA